MLMVEGDRIRATHDRAQILELGVIAEAHIAEHLRRRGILTRGEHAGLHAEFDRFRLHHPCQLAVADDGDDGHPIGVTHPAHCSRPSD